MNTAYMVVHSHYPNDPRVRRQAEVLLQKGWHLSIICLRGNNEPRRQTCDGALVYRLPVNRHRGSGIATYLLEYLIFFVLAFVQLTALFLRQRAQVVQVHNMPDFLVFVALVPRLLGARVILDIHDPVPELYKLKFARGDRDPVIRLTKFIEKISTRFASQVLTVSEPVRRCLVSRGLAPDRITVVMNSADPRLFRQQPQPDIRAVNTAQPCFEVVYHGGIYKRYGLDIAVRAVAALRDQLPGLIFNIYGEGEAVDGLRTLIHELQADEAIHLRGHVPIDAIPKLVGYADLGVVPYRVNPFTELVYPTKAFEYIEMGIPVVIARTQAMADLFGSIPDMLVPPEDVAALMARITELYHDANRRKRMRDMARQVFAPYAWDNQREKYLAVMQHPHTMREEITLAKANQR